MELLQTEIYFCILPLSLTVKMSQVIETDLDSDSDSDSDRGLFNIKLHTKVLHQVYIAKQYEHIEQNMNLA